jgi:uncharacterized membrane protein YebE (DUF533 family)
MFDAKAILESIVRGAAASGSPQGASGGLDEILSEIGKSPAAHGGSGGGIEQAGTADLQNIVAQIRDRLGQAGGALPDSGGIADVIGKILSQATEGVKEGATQIGEATGATEALSRVTSGPEVEQVVAKLKELVQSHPFAAGAAVGGIGGLVLGTRAGKSLAAGAAKLGALAMLGGLAYKAVQNYQAGKPLITGASEATEAPPGSGFEPAAVTSDAATHYIQAMIAAASADGRLDPVEHDRIVDILRRAGLDRDAETFLAEELNHPRSAEDLARSVQSPQEAIQLYAAARIATAERSPAETQFLAALANALGLDQKLTAHIGAMMQQPA